MSEPVVETLNGRLRGCIVQSILGDNYFAFKGVPYAKPPVGKLRFLDPEPAEPWTGIRNATKFGSICAQNNFVLKVIDGSDDCLYLNVYTNSLKVNRPRPVMVWIHGGGFVTGDGNDGLYSPDYLVRKDIVLVTINYRLGVFGFLNLEDETAPGNQGLKDQVMALRWVRDNISNFGGDPGNITIFGESAGGASVHYLAISPLGTGLFHKAICQSGVVLNPWAYLTSNPKRFAYQMCSILGFKSRDHREIVDFLRTVESQRLIEVQDQLLTKEERIQTMFPFGPGIDIKSSNPFMPIHPVLAVNEGIQVPLLIGHNSRESIMSLKYFDGDIEKFNNNLGKYLNSNAIDTLSRVYNLSPEQLETLYFRSQKISKENLETLIDLIGDIKFVEGIHRVLKVQIEKSAAPTYFYQYTYDKTQSFFKTLMNTTMKGACHVDEVQHLFHSKFYELLSFKPFEKDSPGYKIMEQMVDLWVNFATTGSRVNRNSFRTLLSLSSPQWNCSRLSGLRNSAPEKIKTTKSSHGLSNDIISCCFCVLFHTFDLTSQPKPEIQNHFLHRRPTPTTSELVPFYWQPLASDSVLRHLNICEDLRMDVMLSWQQRFGPHLGSNNLPRNKL